MPILGRPRTQPERCLIIAIGPTVLAPVNVPLSDPEMAATFIGLTNRWGNCRTFQPVRGSFPSWASVGAQ
jgi:hypothetical protein